MLHSIRKKYRNLKLPGKMVVVYFIFAGIFFGISIIALQVSLDIFAEKLYEKSLKELDFYAQNVNASLKEVQKTSYELALDTEIQERLSKIAQIKNPSLEYSKELTRLRYKLLSEYKPGSAIRSIRYTDSYNTTLEVGESSWEIPDDTYEELLERFHEAKGAFTMYGPTEEYPYLLCGQDILKSLDMSLDNLGTVVLICDIGKIITKYKENLEAPNATLFVYSKNGVIYQDVEEGERPTLPPFQRGQGYEIVQYQGERYFMCFLNSKSTDWMYVNFFPYSDIYGQLLSVRYMMLIGFVTAFVLILIIMNRVSVAITKPLEQLTESMQIVETGDFQGAKLILVEREGTDEVGVLTREFKVMLDKIDFLIHENYEKQILLKETKYQMLQAQINPHFLYNTLNALHWMVKAGRNEDAGKMIVELGMLLRSTFVNAPYALVDEEIRMVKSYIEIQRFRYQNRAEFEVSTEGKLENYMVPRMILQPLVENAIYYGVDNSAEKCLVRLRAVEETDTILFVVEDTGPGMEKEELEKVRNFTVKPKGYGIGIKNIYERLKITYGEFEFSINSRVGVGTKIQIRIPKVTDRGTSV
ncbi:MAG: yehU 8 [Clostridia bacterium]|jgi:two-component system sensor histidine kinase YesM|nr:yehU 8 [Clostridia bacterium]